MKRWALLILICVAVAYGQGSSIYPYVTTFIRTLLDDADQSTARTTLGVGITDEPSFAGVNLNTTETPASASSTGTTGDVEWDSDYIYVCVSTDTWKRVAIATWGGAAEKIIFAGEDVVYAGEDIYYAP